MDLIWEFGSVLNLSILMKNEQSIALCPWKHFGSLSLKMLTLKDNYY